MTNSRRRFLRAMTAASGAVVAACRRTQPDTTPPSLLGRSISPYGERSPFETSSRLLARTDTPEVASSRTPLQDQYGTITPSALHFERHHAGVPAIDPAAHELLIHGLHAEPRRLPEREDFLM